MTHSIKDKLTKDEITITKHLDGARNTLFYISGNIKSEKDSTYPLIDLSSLTGSPKSLRLDNLIYMIEGDMRIILSYRDQPFLIPLAGRGKLELDKLGGLIGHEIDITLKGVGSFFLGMDISKLGV